MIPSPTRPAPCVSSLAESRQLASLPGPLLTIDELINDR